jgi:hypothetical protein
MSRRTTTIPKADIQNVVIRTREAARHACEASHDIARVEGDRLEAEYGAIEFNRAFQEASDYLTWRVRLWNADPRLSRGYMITEVEFKFKDYAMEVYREPIGIISDVVRSFEEYDEIWVEIVGPDVERNRQVRDNPARASTASLERA